MNKYNQMNNIEYKKTKTKRTIQIDDTRHQKCFFDEVTNILSKNTLKYKMSRISKIKIGKKWLEISRINDVYTEGNTF